MNKSFILTLLFALSWHSLAFSEPKLNSTLNNNDVLVFSDLVMLEQNIDCSTLKPAIVEIAVYEPPKIGRLITKHKIAHTEFSKSYEENGVTVCSAEAIFTVADYNETYLSLLELYPDKTFVTWYRGARAGVGSYDPGFDNAVKNEEFKTGNKFQYKFAYTFRLLYHATDFDGDIIYNEHKLLSIFRNKMKLKD